MAGDFVVEVEGVESLVRKLERVPTAVRPMLEEAAKFAHGKAKEYAKPHPVDKGTIADKVKFKIAPGAVPLEAFVFPAKQVMGIALTLEEGRRPGKRPPAATIERWARRHGIAENGWVLAQRIAQRGTKGVKMFERAALDTERELPKIVGKAAEKIEREFGRHGLG